MFEITLFYGTGTYVPLQAKIWSACTAIEWYLHSFWRELSRRVLYNTRLRDQNTTQVDNRQGRAGTLYVRLLHLPPCIKHSRRDICVQRTVLKSCRKSSVRWSPTSRRWCTTATGSSTPPPLWICLSSPQSSIRRYYEILARWYGSGWDPRIHTSD